MTDAEIMELLTRDCDNWQKGKVLREAFDAITKASQPSALNIKPDKPRKKREPRKPPTQSHDLLNEATHEQ